MYIRSLHFYGFVFEFGKNFCEGVDGEVANGSRGASFIALLRCLYVLRGEHTSISALKPLKTLLKRLFVGVYILISVMSLAVASIGQRITLKIWINAGEGFI